MAKLHELLSVEGDLEGNYKRTLDETKNTFTKKAAHFLGSHRRLKLFDDDAGDPGIDEHKEMDTTVADKLAHQEGFIVRYLDAVLQKETTNQTATADLVIDGVVLGKALPATFLLGLENKLKKIRETYEAIPTLPPGYKWVPDTTKGEGVYAIATPEETYKTEKKFKVQVLYEATKEHPAQVDKLQETENVGKYIKEIWSGMLSPADKSKLLGRIDKLIRETKKARQRANTAEVIKTSVGKVLFEFINNG